jgi:hypothetical protein
MITPGRSITDIKATKSLNGFPYTSLFSITGVINDLTTSFKLVTPSSQIETLPHGQLTTPAFVSVASTSASDTGTGTGGRVGIIVGLDENYNQYEEIFVLNGTTPVQSTNKFAKVFEISLIQFGSNVDATGDSNCVGDIYCGTGTFTAGIPTNPLVCILSSESNANSREAIFTVPDGKILLLKALSVSSQPDKTTNTNAIIQIAIRPFGFGDNFWIKTLPYHFDGIFQNTFEFNLPLPPRTDIQVRAKTNIDKTKTTSVELTCELKDLR